LSIGKELLDTTWRITIPVLIFAALGILADRHFGTKPWVTLSGVVVGFVFATLLVKRQITASEAKDEEGK
jgi:F0F1-type ATP synthase assembly protein I